MNKKKLMQKRLGIQAAIMLAVAAGVGGLVALTGSMATSTEQRKMDAENGLRQDNDQLNALRAQMAQSGAAEKRFVELQLKRISTDFSANSDTLKEWLRVAKDTYRFGNSFKLKLSAEKPSEKAELKNFNGYNVTERVDMQIEMDAISDLHVYSFLDQLVKQAPGLIRVTKLEVSRKADMNGETYAQMAGGIATENATALLEFLWIGIQPKVTAAPATTPAAPGGPPGATPAGAPTPTPGGV